MVTPDAQWLEVVRLNHNLGKIHDAPLARFSVQRFALDGVTPEGEPRVLEVEGRRFRKVGLGKDVEAMMHPWRETDAGTFANSRRETMLGMEIHEVGTHGWRDAAFFDQPEFDARLREWIEAEPLVETRYGHQVTDLGESGSGLKVFALSVSRAQGFADLV